MKVFICSPLRANEETSERLNKDFAKAWCLYASLMGHFAFAPHLYFTQFLDDLNEDERIIGIELGKQFLREADVLWVFLNGRKEISSGMREEIELAEELGITIQYFHEDAALTIINHLDDRLAA